MKLTKVDSSNLEAVAYNQREKRLTINFTNGARYSYQGVPQSAVKGLMAADSHGAYFASHIRTVYPYQQIKPPKEGK